MERTKMPARTVYRYDAQGTHKPVLILRPRERVWPNEVVGTKDEYGSRLQVSYVRGTAPKTPGMLGIIWRKGTDEQRVEELEKLVDISQDDLLHSEFGRLLLPEHAVAVVVYPRNITATWAGWKRMLAMMRRPRTPEELAEQERREEERRAADALKESVVNPVKAALASFGAEASDIYSYRWFPYLDDDRASLDVNVTLPLLELMKLIPVEIPDWAQAELETEVD